jgi:excisionase family DNA binding protein
MDSSAPEHTGDVPAHLHDTPYVQALLDCSAAKVYELVRRGELGCYKTGHRSLRFSDEHIAQFLASREVAS